MQVLVPAAVGDVVDRITILELKAERLRDAQARNAARSERAGLADALRSAGVDLGSHQALVAALATANTALWEIEEAMRAAQRAEDDEAILRLSREIVVRNAERSRVKAAINAATGSALQELKDYASGSDGDPL